MTDVVKTFTGISLVVAALFAVVCVIAIFACLIVSKRGENLIIKPNKDKPETEHKTE